MARTVMIQNLKALGAAQIMIGGVILCFGIVLDRVINGATIESRVTYWGSVFFVIAGVLSVTSVDRCTPTVMKASLVMNVISVLSAVVAVITISTDFGNYFSSMFCRSCLFKLTQYYSHLFMKQIIGTAGVLLVFAIFEVFVSITILVLTWKSRCSPETTPCSTLGPISNPPEECSSSP